MTLDAFISMLMDSYVTMFLWLAALFVGCSFFEWVSPCNPGQPRWRKDIITDVLYYFVMPFFTRFVRLFFLAIGIYILFYNQPEMTIQKFLVDGYGPLAQLPIWAQAALIFLVSDVVLYWAHRWFHGAKLWKYHAIHHSSPHVDWLSTYRFHPVNVWFTFTLLDVFMLLVGFSPAAIAQLAAFNTIYSAMVHSNVNWTFGPFRYIFASPVFHRWHHTSQAEGMDKNFAPTFPLLDIIFGTFYMPEGRVPDAYGVHGSNIPDGFIGQLVWPFKQK